jgi:hypothetical protein
MLTAVALVFAACSPAAPTPRAKTTTRSVPHIIFDTDLSLYWDDVTALGIANVLQQRDKVQILGIGSDIRNTAAVAAIDAIDTAYGHGAIPVGAVADSSAGTVREGYDSALTDRLPHKTRSSADAPNAVTLYRRLLASQPDHSVIMVAVGAYTNLAGLLRSKPGQGSALNGRALVAAKVKRLVIEDGFFPYGTTVAATNTKYDVPAARVVVTGTEWPTPIAWVDGTTGVKTQVGAALCSKAPARNPMRIVYTALFGCGPPGDGDWDGPTMLYAIDDSPGLFSELGQGGAVVMNTAGGMSWQTATTGQREIYIHVLDQTAVNDHIDRLLEAR